MGKRKHIHKMAREKRKTCEQIVIETKIHERNTTTIPKIEIEDHLSFIPFQQHIFFTHHVRPRHKKRAGWESGCQRRQLSRLPVWRWNNCANRERHWWLVVQLFGLLPIHLLIVGSVLPADYRPLSKHCDAVVAAVAAEDPWCWCIKVCMDRNYEIGMEILSTDKVLIYPGIRLTMNGRTLSRIADQRSTQLLLGQKCIRLKLIWSLRLLPFYFPVQATGERWCVSGFYFGFRMQR